MRKFRRLSGCSFTLHLTFTTLLAYLLISITGGNTAFPDMSQPSSWASPNTRKQIRIMPFLPGPRSRHTHEAHRHIHRL